MDSNIENLMRIVQDGLSGRTGVVEVAGDSEVLYGFSSSLQELPRHESERVVVLELMDLTILPKSVNILASILVRIESSLRSPMSDLGRGRGGGLLNFGDEDALSSLQRFQTSIILGFNGNVPERKGHLDPDTYAVEMHRAEYARLGVPETFESTLTALANQFFGGIQPLFAQCIILPMNDRVPPQLRLFRSPLFLALVARGSV